MKYKMPTRFAIEALTIVIALQLIITPCKLLAQSETSDIDALNNRRLRAEVEQAEAAARKAEADAAKLRSDIAKQDIETRRAQIEALKTTSTVEGALVENSIAASKALGCAAWNIADQIKDEGDLKPGTLVLFSEDSLRGLSDYTALSLQLDSANNDYPAADKAVRDKLEEIRKEELAKLIELEKKLEAELKLLQTTKTSKFEFEFFKHGFKSTNVASIESMKTASTDPVIGTIADFSSLAGGPASIITTAALTSLAMFKTDISLKGTDAEPGNQELSGYLFRLLSFELKNDKIQKIADTEKMTLVNPD
ncbi:MAG TPA: hypothetical protein VJL58_02915, partial [Pyrinomonadaceae bacterium]|nr:hypothetical protein [Pyrinomonadaceae bacterium]